MPFKITKHQEITATEVQPPTFDLRFNLKYDTIPDIICGISLSDLTDLRDALNKLEL